MATAWYVESKVMFGWSQTGGPYPTKAKAEVFAKRTRKRGSKVRIVKK